MKSVLTLGLLFMSAYSFALQAAVIYVNQFATGNNNGLSWADAYQDLQTALATARAGDELWVAGGDYRPTTGTDRYATFTLPTGVKLYGGFAGTESTLAERDWTNFPTFLNGDIGIPGNHRDNSYSVITVPDPDEHTVLDGFDIRNGAANDENIATPAYDPARIGGGLLISTSAKDSSYHLSVRNSRFFNNYAILGGAVYTDARERNKISTAFVNCEFELNQAGNGSAFMTGLGNTGPEGIRFEGCTFYNNSSGNHGVLYILTDTEEEGSVTIADCGFIENSQDLIYVEGVAVDHPLRVLVRGSTFRSNRSEHQGFNLLRADSRKLHLSLDSLTFRGNEGYNQLIALGELDTLLIRESTFVGNEAITLMEGRPRFFLAEDCRISQNTLTGDGMRMEGIRLAVKNCLLEGNEADELIKLNENRFQGTIYPEGAFAELEHCTLRGNSSDKLIEIGGDSAWVAAVQVIDSQAEGRGEIEFSALHAIIANSLFSRTSTGGQKAALLNSKAGSELNIINSTVYNYVDSDQGAVLLRKQPFEDADTVLIRFRNSILWHEGEVEQPLFYLQNATVSLEHSLLPANSCDSLYRTEPNVGGELLPASVRCGAENIYAQSPQFRAIDQEDFRLQACSPAINSGNSGALPAGLVTDLSGAERIANGPVDLGAYEYQEDLPTLEVEAEVVPASSEGAADGSISLLGVQGGTPEYAYHWSTGDTISGLIDLAPGDYQLTLSDGGGCTETFVFTVGFTSTTVDPAVEWGIRLAPNPAAKGTPGYLRWTGNRPAIRRMRLIGPQGNLIWENSGPVRQLLPAPDAGGLYLLELTDDSGRRGYLKWLVP